MPLEQVSGSIEVRANRLVREFREGSISKRQAFTEIHTLIQPRIYSCLRNAYGYVQDQDVKDLYQDFFVTFLQDDAYDVERPLMPYLVTSQGRKERPDSPINKPVTHPFALQ